MFGRRSGRAIRLADRSGFTLIEVLVAFVILSVLLSVLLRSVVGMRDDAVTVDARTHSEVVARATLEDALADRALRNGTYSGLRDGTRWTLKATAVDLTAQLPPPKPRDKAADQQQSQQQQQDADAKPSWKTQRLVVLVETGRRPVEVETLRLVRAAEP